MNFWNNPKYRAARVVLLVIVVIGAGYFAVNSRHLTSGNAGQVIDTAAMQSTASQNGAASASTGSGLVFAETTSGKACTITVTNAANTSQSIAIAGAISGNGDCRPNGSQSTPAAQSMAAAMGAGASVASPAVATGTGLTFLEKTTGSTCTMTVTNAANTAQAVTIAGTIKGSNDCVANSQQSSPAAQALAASMAGGASVQ